MIDDDTANITPVQKLMRILSSTTTHLDCNYSQVFPKSSVDEVGNYLCILSVFIFLFGYNINYYINKCYDSYKNNNKKKMQEKRKQKAIDRINQNKPKDLNIAINSPIVSPKNTNPPVKSNLTENPKILAPLTIKIPSTHGSKTNSPKSINTVSINSQKSQSPQIKTSSSQANSPSSPNQPKPQINRARSKTDANLQASSQKKLKNQQSLRQVSPKQSSQKSNDKVSFQTEPEYLENIESDDDEIYELTVQKREFMWKLKRRFLKFDANIKGNSHDFKPYYSKRITSWIHLSINLVFLILVPGFQLLAVCCSTFASLSCISSNVSLRDMLGYS